jgi:hypothetical protein
MASCVRKGSPQPARASPTAGIPSRQRGRRRSAADLFAQRFAQGRSRVRAIGKVRDQLCVPIIVRRADGRCFEHPDNKKNLIEVTTETLAWRASTRTSRPTTTRTPRTARTGLILWDNGAPHRCVSKFGVGLAIIWSFITTIKPFASLSTWSFYLYFTITKSTFAVFRRLIFCNACRCFQTM